LTYAFDLLTFIYRVECAKICMYNNERKWRRI